MLVHKPTLPGPWPVDLYRLFSPNVTTLRNHLVNYPTKHARYPALIY